MSGPSNDEATSPEESSGKSRGGRSCLGSITRGTLRTVGWVSLLVAIGALGLLKTAAGNAALLEFGLDRVRGQIAGQIEVGEIRSGNLLRGAMLTDVRLTTLEGDTLAVADSLQASYRVLGLLRGQIGLSGVRVWGGQLNLDKPTPAARGTLGRWLGGSGTEGSPSPASPEGGGGVEPEGGGFALVLTDVRVEDFRFRLRQPTGLSPDGVVRVDTSGAPALALDLQIDHAVLPRISIGPESSGGIEARLAEATAELELLQEPIRFESLQASVQVSGGEVRAQLDEVQMGAVQARGAAVVQLDRELTDLVTVELQVDAFDTEPFLWISDAIPEMTGSTQLSGVVRRDGTSRWSVEDADARIAEGRVTGGGAVEVQDPGISLDDLELRYSGIRLDDLERWLPESAQVGGVVQGTLTATGPLDGVRMTSRTTWATPEDRRVTADLQGRLTGLGVAGAMVGFDGFEFVLDPLNWSAVREAVPSSPLQGTGSLRGELFGTFEQGLRYSAEAQHTPPSAGTRSRVVSSGTLVMRDSVLAMDVVGDLSPLNFTSLSEGWEEMPLRGSVSGTVRARGELTALALSANLRTEFGRVELQGTVDPRDPAAGFQLSGVVDSVRAGNFFPSLGESTLIFASVDIQGSGSSVATANGSGGIRLRDSEVRGVPIDSLSVRARVADGQMIIDTLFGRGGGFDLRALGTLALADSLPSGTLQAEFETESLMGLRPLFLGDSVLARPEEGLERRALEAEGIDPDTLPTLDEVTWGGRGSGTVTLRGSLESFELNGTASVDSLQVGPNKVSQLRIRADGSGFPSREARADIVVEADSLLILQREFTVARIEGEVGLNEGRLRMDLGRDASEAYLAVGGFTRDTLGGQVNVDSLALRFDSLDYALVNPTRLAWSDSSLTVDSLELVREGVDPVRIRASGTLPRFGEADFSLDIEGLQIERLTQVLQRSDVDAAGRITLSTRVTGRGQSPIITGTIRADSLRWEELVVERLEGTLDYQNRVAALDVSAWRGDARVLDVTGTVPVNLTFRQGAERFLDEEMDLEVRADELRAASAFALIPDLEDVEGMVSGRFSVAGTLDQPRTAGVATLTGGAWTIGSLGVRHTEVTGEASLDEANVVTVSVEGRSEGTISTSGTITLAPLDDPALDLSITLDNFLAVDRRDVVGVVSGEVRLHDSYRSPNLDGALTVDAGEISLDEFVRNASVVDLTNPRYRDLLEGLNVDNTNQLLNIQGNPFVNGLLVDVELNVDRNTWLRGQDLNVEIGGELDILYDRGERDFVFQGDLLARRGQYSTLGRTFQVQEGTVEFIGTPGLNPDLNITATTRVRRPEASDLTVSANLTGTLLDPRLRLSSDDSGISESDVISYLVLGQPSSDVTSSLTGSSNQALGTVAGTGANLLTGTIASRLGSLAAQNTDFIDYLSITGLGEAAPGSAGNAYSLASTQVELGRYFANGDIFGALVLRAAQLRSQPIGGARLEWQTSDQFHVEAFFEDRFLRVASLGLAELGSGSAYVFGFALVREWGY